MKKYPFFIFLLLLVVVSIFFLSGTYWIDIAPRAKVTTAISNFCNQLEHRFEHDPMLTLLDSADPDGKYTLYYSATIPTTTTGDVVSKGSIQINGSDKEILVDGSVETLENCLDLSVYLDRHFAAVSANSQSKDMYYGITYDTFSKDLANSPFFAHFSSKDTIAQWERMAETFRSLMVNLKVPAFSLSQLVAKGKPLLLGLVAMPCEVEEQNILVDDQYRRCTAVIYQFNGAAASELLSSISDLMIAEDAAAEILFYLLEDTLVRTTVRCSSGKDSVQYVLCFGSNPIASPIQVTAEKYNDGHFQKTELRIETQNKDDSFLSSWNICAKSDGSVRQESLSYEWSPTDGKIQAVTTLAENPICFTFAKTETGIKIITDDLWNLISPFIADMEAFENNEPISSEIQLCKGANFQKPEYLNIDQWTMDDILFLLQNIGVLLGIDLTQ